MAFEAAKRAGRGEVLECLLSVAQELELDEDELRELNLRLAVLLQALRVRCPGATVAGAFRMAGTGEGSEPMRWAKKGSGGEG
jgi:hypothetical protein